jgi:subtilisin family serine protease
VRCSTLGIEFDISIHRVGALTNMKAIWVLSSATLISLGMGPHAWANQNPSQLVVRFKNSAPVRLNFASPDQAIAARAKLLLQSNVENVAPNFLYHLAISYHFHDVARAMTYLAAPFAASFNLTGNQSANQAAGQPWDESIQVPDVQPAPENVVEGIDPLAGGDWAMGKIRMPSVDDVRGTQGSNTPIIAAVIDTGVDYNHEDLNGAMWRNPSNPQEAGYDFAHNSDKPFDIRHFDLDGCFKDDACKLGQDTGKFLTNPGHGTHCAGHVGAVANNSIGIRGVGGNVQVMALKFFYNADETNAGQGDDAAAIQSIDYAIQHGAKVISASWGGRNERAAAEKSELKNALIRAQKAGVLVVIAAGNDAINQDSDSQPDFPAAYQLDNLIIVAASDQNDQLASFSNFGAQSVDIAAPGVKILSTTTGGSPYNDVVASYTDANGNAHELDWDGTSMATPIVAGAAALVWSKYPDESYQQIKSRLMKSARQTSGLRGKVVTGGVLDVSAALESN